MEKNTKKTQNKGQGYGQIMGIKVTSTDVSLVLARVENFISDNTKFSIVTPNPELILMAQKNPELKIALNSAELSIPDGVGLKLVIPNLKIIKGRELFLELIKLADEKRWRVFLLGGIGREAELAARNLQFINHNLQIEYAKGPFLDNNANPVTEVDTRLQSDIVEKINSFKPQLLFVAFGNPKQEIWIHNNLSKLNICGAMVVGGTLRYVAGLAKLPPKWMESLGLEWLWRLIHEPSRIGRIFNAVVVFPIKVFLYKLHDR